MLTDTARELLSGPNFAHFATIMRDGSPQVTPVWVDTDGTHVLINSADGRVKVHNVRRDPHVALDIVDQTNPYRAVTIRGKVVEITEQGAEQHADQLAKKYLGKDHYPKQPGERRVILRILPEKVHG